MASTTGNTPCTKPELCGVKTHRPGTQALCQQTKGVKGATGSASNLTAQPKITSNADRTPLEFDDEGFADIDVNGNEVLESMDVMAMDDDEGNFHAFVVTGRTVIDFHRQLPESWSKKQKDEWLNDHNKDIEKFLNDRYGVQGINGDDWEYQVADFTQEFSGDTITEEEAVNAIWEDTKIVTLANELDRGSFGHENFDRVFAEALEIPEDDPSYQPSLTEVMTKLDDLNVDYSDDNITFNYDKGEFQIDTPFNETARESDPEFRAWRTRQKQMKMFKEDSAAEDYLNYRAFHYAKENGASEGGFTYKDSTGQQRIVAKFTGSHNLVPFMRKHHDV